MTYKKTYETWLTHPSIDEETLNELKQMDEKTIKEIQKLASDFAKKNYKYGVTDLTVDRTIKQIKNNQ